MNKSILTIMLCICGLAFTSCTKGLNDISESENSIPESVSVSSAVNGLTKIGIPDGIESVNVYNWADNSFIGTVSVRNNHIWIGSTNAPMTVKLYSASNITRASIDDLSLNYIKDATVYKSEDNIISIQKATNATSAFNGDDFIKIFPAGKDNRNIAAPEGVTNFQNDVLYVSNGEPFDVYPIYSCGWYDLTLGIFYYDTNSTRHDISFWDMLTVNWKPSYSYLSGNNINDPRVFTVSKTENAEGYQITLPEGYVYGFYITSPQGGKFYCYSNENACNEKHSVNLVKDGINYLAFEDKDNGDWDINDLICYVEPKQKVIDNPDEAKKQEAIDTITQSIVIPDNVDKIVHSITNDSCDIEARYDGKGHDYVRIAKPLKNNEEIEFDLSNLDQYCEADDFRIVTKNDVEVIYCKDGESSTIHYNGSEITVSNKCTKSHYGKVNVCVTGKDNDGVYQMKVDMYPKDEKCFNDIVALMDNKEWDKLFKMKWTRRQ